MIHIATAKLIIICPERWLLTCCCGWAITDRRDNLQVRFDEHKLEEAKKEQAEKGKSEL